MTWPRFWNEQIETAPREQLDAMQARKLRRQLAYLYESSPFYRDKLDAAGVAVEDVRTVADLAHLPFTEKSELRDSLAAAQPLGLHQAADYTDVIRIHSSSGTTGNPTYVGLTRHDQEVWQELMSRVMWSQGVRPDSVVIMGLRMGFFVGGLPLQDGIENIGATLVPVGVGESLRLVESMKATRGTHLLATPSYASYLSGWIREKFGHAPSDLGLQRIHVGGEPGGSIPEVRKALEGDWGAMVTEGLGNTDVAPIYAGECEEQEGIHFMGPDYLALELIDPDTGEVLDTEGADGLMGELVFTHLDRECSPLLRFRTCDHVIVWDKPCPCGRTGIRFRCVGRTDDMLIVRGVNVWPSAIKDVVMSLRPRTTGELRIVLPEPGPRVEPPLRLKIEVEQGAGDAEALRAAIADEIRTRLIFSPAIDLVPAGSLPRTEMKAQLIEIAS